MSPHHVQGDPPAKRLVLFVADGLRADKFFEMVIQADGTLESRAPFLREIVEKKGSWGVSHTRVPTETRPGHVALIAGFYEDVSAVTKGWKSNPVEFDHLFNETRYSWGYGSPDILPMFSDHVPHMTSLSYPPEAEDFGSDASKLDTWVFDKIEELLNNATRDYELMQKLKSDRIVLFLHLLGLDTNGHAYRPYSEEYYKNIRVVDTGIKKITELLDKFYDYDGRTSYVFTADHGMSNRGSHGDGERANTETPLVAWGSGVRGPLPSSVQMERVTKLKGKGKEHLYINPDTPSDWHLGGLLRSDVSQADIAPLMSSLIGVPCPLNSVGVLPTDYLSTSDSYTTQALYSNTMQIWEMFRLKSETKRKSSLFFSPFAPLAKSDQYLNQIASHMALEQYDDAQFLCQEFIELCLQGLNYFQTYDRPFLMTMITLGYLGWIFTLSLYVMNNYTMIGMKCEKDRLNELTPKFNTISRYILLGLSVGLYGFLYCNEAPLLYYLYCSFVILFWGRTIPFNLIPLYMFLQKLIVSGSGGGDSSATGQPNSIVKNFTILVASAVFVMELLVIAYFERKVLSFLYILLGLWSLVAMNLKRGFKVFWMVSCFAMSVFPTLPIDYGSDTNLVCIGGALIALLGIASQYIYLPSNQSDKSTSTTTTTSFSTKPKWKVVNLIIIATIMVSTWLVFSTDRSLVQKIGLPYFNQVSSWTILFSSFIVLGVYRGKNYYDHWSFICLTLAVPFVLLSVSYETLFFGFFILNLSLWMILESQIDKKPPQSTSDLNINITQHDIRRAIIYIFFCYIGFFGTGNIASISSFEISSTYRFTTIFDPFLMGALLLVKIFIPLLLVAVSFSLLNNSLNISRPGSFLVVIALTDLMSISFFFLVKDTGSWLEIGTSISHYGISNAFIILQLLLFAVSSLLVPTGGKEMDFNKIK
eukprot:gene1942-2377_t